MKGIALIFLLILNAELVASHCDQSGCICYEEELNQLLKETRPPKWKEDTLYSNFHNISRALFPPRRGASRYIDINLHFYKVGTPNLRNETYSEKFIWSITCAYAILPPLVLRILSLLTLHPERSKTTLDVSLPEFCARVSEEDRTRFMSNTLSSLQDLVIVPITSDPQLNTAECLLRQTIFEKLEPLGETKLLITAITQIAFAVLGGISFAYTYQVWSRKQENSINKTSLILFGKLAGTVEFFIAVAVFFLCFPWKPKLPSQIHFHFIDFSGDDFLYSVYFPFFFHSTIIFGLILSVCKNKLFIYSIFMAICYHLSWIVIAIFTDPYWSIPIFLTIAVSCLFIFLLIYQHIAQCDSQKRHFEFKSVRTIVCFWAFCGYASFLCFITFTVNYFLTNQTLFGFFQTSLMSVLGIIASIILYKFPAVIPMTDASHDIYEMRNLSRTGSFRSVRFEDDS